MLTCIIVIIALFGWVYLCEKCLMLIVKPVRYSEAEIRELEIAKGFEGAIEDYECSWQREDFAIDSGGVTIRGEIIRNPEAADKVAIICHGHTVNRYASLKYAKLFYEKGFNIVIYDERSFGRSGGRICTLGEKEAKDLKLVIDHTRKVFGEECRIILHGESMGAATALLVLQYFEPELVIADCPFADSERLFGEYVTRNLHLPPFVILPLLKVLARIQYNYHISDTSPMKAVSRSDVPICLIHGSGDTLIECDHSRVLSEACRNENSEFHIFEGVGHARSIASDQERYRKIVYDFLDKNMKE